MFNLCCFHFNSNSFRGMLLKDEGEEEISRVIYSKLDSVRDTLVNPECRAEIIANDLFKAAHFGDLEWLTQILSIDSSYINAKTSSGQSSLWVACAEGHLDIIHYLVSQGADFLSHTYLEASCLYAACSENRYDIAEYLISVGAEVNVPENSRVESCLWIAARFGYVEIAELLISHGAELEWRDNNFNAPPLWIAAVHGHDEVIKYLLKCGADVETRNIFGASPLWMACRHGLLPIAELLLDSGANVDSINKMFRASCLCIAVDKGHIEIAELLIRRRANVNIQDFVSPFEADKTPLHIACEFEHFEIIKLLVSEGADIDAMDKDGKYPVEYALISSTQHFLTSALHWNKRKDFLCFMIGSEIIDLETSPRHLLMCEEDPSAIGFQKIEMTVFDEKNIPALFFFCRKALYIHHREIAMFL